MTHSSMTKLKGQAFDTEKLYGGLGLSKLEEYARITGLSNGNNLDAEIYLNFIESSVLEVGCGYGRIGKDIISKVPKYYGIDLHEPFIDFFRNSVSEDQRKNIFYGNFLDYVFPFENIDRVLFPWSVIGDFESGEGQLSALRKSSSLLSIDGKILLDIPTDIVNNVGGYHPGHFKVYENYDLSEMELKHTDSYSYKTYTGRKREIIELSKSQNS